MGIGFSLLLAGAALPFIMVFNMVESTLALNILAVLCSVGGVAMGLLGMNQYGRWRK